MSRFEAIRKEIEKIEDKKETLFDFDKIVGREIRKERKKNGLKTRELSDAMGFKTKSALVLIETGQRKLSFRAFAKMVKAFDHSDKPEAAADFVRRVFLKI